MIVMGRVMIANPHRGHQMARGVKPELSPRVTQQLANVAK